MLAGTSQSERARSDVQLRSELNPVLDEALREIVAHSPGLAESPCRSLCVEIHTKLNRFCGTYDPRLLELVSEHVEVALPSRSAAIRSTSLTRRTAQARTRS